MTKQSPGTVLRVARAARRLSQADLAVRSGVSKWRIVEVERDRLQLRPDEADAVAKVLRGEVVDVQKLSVGDNVTKRADAGVQKAFDAIEAALAGEITDEQRRRLATSLLTLRQAIGLDAVKMTW